MWNIGELSTKKYENTAAQKWEKTFYVKEIKTKTE